MLRDFRQENWPGKRRSNRKSEAGYGPASDSSKLGNRPELRPTAKRLRRLAARGAKAFGETG